ncbi:hypothetical protein GQ600_8038 [Phytophthora cactorum]|nr:hypothetical protein GQ600_8038 [Phytophthora cactorum]
MRASTSLGTSSWRLYLRHHRRRALERRALEPERHLTRSPLADPILLTAGVLQKSTISIREGLDRSKKL